MSPDGTLLAYSIPTNIKELRDQAALISLTWRDHDPTVKAVAEQMKEVHTDKHNNSTEPMPAKLKTLTVECDTHNVIVRSIQPQMLLVLLGGVPPNRKINFKITAELQGDASYPSVEVVSSLRGRQSVQHAENGDTLKSPLDEGWASNSASPGSSQHSPPSDPAERNKHRQLGILSIHRKKLEALSTYIKDDLETRGFVMPNLEDLGKPLS